MEKLKEVNFFKKPKNPNRPRKLIAPLSKDFVAGATGAIVGIAMVGAVAGMLNK